MIPGAMFINVLAGSLYGLWGAFSVIACVSTLGACLNYWLARLLVRVMLTCSGICSTSLHIRWLLRHKLLLDSALAAAFWVFNCRKMKACLIISMMSCRNTSCTTNMLGVVHATARVLGCIALRLRSLVLALLPERSMRDFYPMFESTTAFAGGAVGAVSRTN